MKLNLLLHTAYCLLCLPLLADAQTIVRSTLASSGATLSGSAGILTSTFGSCPGCSTLKADAGYLTQGFQQPSGEPCAEPVLVNFNVQNESCPGDLDGKLSATTSGGTPPYAFAWSSGQTTETIEGIAAAAYTLTVTDARGCTLEAAAEVAQECLPAVGDIITPNGDGENDAWLIAKIDLFPENEVQVFNRWGGLVWQADGYLNNWNGTNAQGEPLPLGAYYYVVKLNDGSGKVMSGALTIVR